MGDLLAGLGALLWFLLIDVAWGDFLGPVVNLVVSYWVIYASLLVAYWGTYLAARQAPERRWPR